jgi:hypothetical protein
MENSDVDDIFAEIPEIEINPVPKTKHEFRVTLPPHYLEFSAPITRETLSQIIKYASDLLKSEYVLEIKDKENNGYREVEAGGLFIFNGAESVSYEAYVFNPYNPKSPKSLEHIFYGLTLIETGKFTDDYDKYSEKLLAALVEAHKKVLNSEPDSYSTKKF